MVFVLFLEFGGMFEYMENLMSERKSDQRSTLLAEIIVWRDGTPGEESKALSIRGHS